MYLLAFSPIIAIFLIYKIIGFLYKRDEKGSQITDSERVHHDEEQLKPLNLTSYPNNKPQHKEQQLYPYHKKYILTKNEYAFYQQMKYITKPMGLEILTKIRLADLVEVDSGIAGWNGYFSKIKSKHIDFAIADNMNILLLIELDDWSHQRADRQERDDFVNTVLAKCGYTMLRTYGDTEAIKRALKEKGYICTM